MKIFRIAFIIPAIIVITLVWVFFAFFLDSILKSALIFTGQAIFSAKVEVGSFRTSFKSFSININSLKIGDKDKEFQNLADIDNINFKLRFIPLLSKKFIIDNMSVDGFKWSTTRKTSAKLPPKKQKKNEEQGMFSKALDSAKEKAQSEFNQFSAVQNFNEIKKQAENFSIEGAMDFAGIKSADIVKKSYEDISQRYEGYIKSVEGMDIEKQIASIKVLADNISKTNIKTVDDAAKLQNNLKELSAQKSQLETQFNDLKKMQEDISKDIKTSKDGAKDINALINGDIADILSKLSIPSLGSNESIRMLFGNIWVERINTIVYYMSLIRHYMPQKKAGAQANAEPAPLRLKGRDIVFPLKGVLPKLWIANISISANSGGEGKDENPIFYKGSVQNITSDQKVIGKNTSFEIVSDDKKQIVKISGVFDRLKEIPSDTITFFAQGVGASMLGIPDSAYTPSFNNAKMMVKADFSLIGSDFISDLNLNLYSFSYDAQSSSLDAVSAKYMSMLWKGINSMNVKAGFSILEGGSLKTSFSSDIDSMFSKRFSEIVKSEIGDIENKVRQEVNKYIGEQTKEYQEQAQKYMQDAQKLLSGDMKNLQTAIDIVNKLYQSKEKEIKEQAGKAVGNAIKGLFK